MDSSKSVVAWVVGVAVVALGGIAYFLNGNKAPKDSNSDQTTNATDSSSNETGEIGADTTPAPTSGYKDGSYTATGEYRTPQGSETLTVALTLKNGIITTSSVSGTHHAPETVRFQGMFISGYKPQVEGKSIDSLNVTHVSGSSLTPIGFNDAIAKIKIQAKS